MKPRACLLSFFILNVIHFWQTPMIFGQAADKEEEAKKGGGWIVLPVVYYTPETSLAFGLGAMYYFRLSGQESKQRPSSVRTLLVYTQKKQWMIIFSPEFYLKNEQYLLQGNFMLSKFKSKFWGVGPDTLEEDEEDYGYRVTDVFLKLQKKIFSRLNFALQYEHQNNNVTEIKERGLLETGLFLGSEGAKVSGLSLLVNWDSRDNIFSPSRGSFCQSAVTFFRKTFGSDYHFDRFNLDLRTYFRLLPDHVLAIHGFFSFTSGELPFQMLPFLGGPMIMRGFYQGRYRDRHAVVFHMEYRLPLWRRLSAVGFASAGDVADKISRFILTNFKIAFGTGIRFALKPEEKLNLRFDIGFSRESVGFYFTLTEAF